MPLYSATAGPAGELTPRRQRLAAFLGVAVAEADPVIPGIHLVGRDRIAHLSADTSAMDIYVYPFGTSRAPPVLRGVSYGQRFSCGSAG